jgi:hypothetical protein
MSTMWLSEQLHRLLSKCGPLREDEIRIYLPDYSAYRISATLWNMKAHGRVMKVNDEWHAVGERYERYKAAHAKAD